MLTKTGDDDGAIWRIIRVVISLHLAKERGKCAFTASADKDGNGKGSGWGKRSEETEVDGEGSGEER